MASVPVEDAGVGSAVNDVARELGSALGVAILGTFISSIYRSNVEDELAGRVPDDVVEAATEGIGVVAGTLPSLPPDVAATTFQGASTAFVDAMNAGFWFSAAVLGSAVGLAAWLLPNTARTDQVLRDDASEKRPLVSSQTECPPVSRSLLQGGNHGNHGKEGHVESPAVVP
jgi:DHA2 family multidrug resistance protein-like MFS transporter